MRIRRFRAGALALALSLSLSTPALASQALGHEIHKTVVPVAPGVTYTKQVLWSDSKWDSRYERYFTYTPGEGVYPMMSYGDNINSTATVANLAKRLEDKGHRVVGGVNGDYFVLATGEPLGLLVSDGVLRSSDSYFSAVGFSPDGTAFIGKPSLTITAQTPLGDVAVKAVNKRPGSATGAGHYLYTPDFGTATPISGTHIVLNPIPDATGQAPGLSIGGSVDCLVAGVTQAEWTAAIQPGQMILTVSADSDPYHTEQALALMAGDKVTIAISSDDTRWNGVATAIGGYSRIVENGQLGPDVDNTPNPRTAIGVKADGTALFYAIDGRQSGYSVGATLSQVGQRLIELGCVEAVGLDGGGSTVMVGSMPWDTAAGVLNKPSEQNRRVSNGIFLVSDLRPTGEASSLLVGPQDNILLSGAQVALTAAGLDKNCYPAAYSGGLTWAVTEGGGSVEEDGLFTAGEAGTSTVTASTDAGLTGTALITTVSDPDTVTISREDTGKVIKQLLLDPNETVDLTAAASHRHLNLTADDTCFTWTADPAIGAVDAQGRLTAASATASGTLTVSAGATVVRVPVSVTGQLQSLNTFESSGQLGLFTATDTASLAAETDESRVKFGRQSGRLSYDAAGGTANLAANLPIPANRNGYLSLWVYGDGSANVLTAAVSTDAGVQDLALCALDFTGWQRFQVALPAGARSVTGLHVIFTGGERAEGTLWLDQMVVGNEPLLDDVPPTVSITRSGSKLTATVGDNIDRSFLSSQIAVTLDGKALDFQWNADTGVATVTLPQDTGLLRRLRLTATDQSGNIGQAGLDLAPETPQAAPFEDMEAHWAKDYAAALAAAGVIQGQATATGYAFAPDREITRGEFFLMVARWMGLDLTAYRDVELPFSDLDAIPTWALDGIKAMYATGVIKGSQDGAQLQCRAVDTISRAEAMTVLGRIQAKGYGRQDLAFSDAAAVPAWALPYVESLVYQGVISGHSDGTLAPSSPMKRAEAAKVLFCLT